MRWTRIVWTLFALWILIVYIPRGIVVISTTNVEDIGFMLTTRLPVMSNTSMRLTIAPWALVMVNNPSDGLGYTKVPGVRISSSGKSRARYSTFIFEWHPSCASRSLMLVSSNISCWRFWSRSSLVIISVMSPIAGRIGSRVGPAITGAGIGSPSAPTSALATGCFQPGILLSS